MSGTEAECEFIYNPEDKNEHLSGVVYYQGDLSRCQEWKFNADGTISTSAKHNYVNNKCVTCGDYNTQGVVYNYDENKECYYVGDNKTLNVSVVTILATYNDGVHGEAAVTYVKNSAFINNSVITKVVLPTSVTSLDGSVFQGCSNLEYVSMIGVADMAFLNLSGQGIYANETEIVTNNNFLGCVKLKYLVVNQAFNIFRDSPDAQQFVGDAKCIDLYVMGSEADSNVRVIGGTGNNGLLSGNIYYKADDTAEVKCLQWKFDENGEIVHGASAHSFVDGKCEHCGVYNT